MTLPDFTHHTIDHYRLERCLQQRPLTSLYLGHDTQQEQPVFVEIVNSVIADDEALAGRFQRRMETVRQLDHPHIAPVLQIGRTNLKKTKSRKGEKALQQQYAYAIIEYVSGPTLAEQIESWRETGNWPAVPELLALIHGLASALTAAHPVGIFHHDLRPSNLIMGENGRLILIDLGVPIPPAPPVTSPNPQNPPAQLDYASPEQLDGKPLSGPSNIYSLGVILYELLAGQRPHLPLSDWNIFERTDLPREIPLEEVRYDLTADSYTVVKNCLWRQDWNRYETAVHLVNALAAARTAEEKVRSDFAANDKLSLPVWRYAGLGLLLLLLLIGGIWLLL
jgi:serine/threonine protein kinase